MLYYPEFKTNLIRSSRVYDNDIFHVSDHLPIHTCISIPIIMFQQDNNPSSAWNKCTHDNLSMYQCILNNELQTFDLATLTQTSNNRHIESLYSHIVKSITIASKQALPVSHFN